MSRVPAAKRRRLTPPDSDASLSPLPSQSRPGVGDFYSRASKWSLEQDYEQRPRKLSKKGKENSKLPIKTPEGWIEQALVPAPDAADTDSFLDSETDNQDDQASVEEQVVQKPRIPAKQQVLEAKEELARLAGLINEDPEEHAGLLRALAKVASSPNTTVKKLALATQLAVYKDIIPGYRIRPLSDTDPTLKLSKEVRKLRDFEQALVGGYQAYVQELAKYAKGSKIGSTPEFASLATVAISCACNLLTSVPHFNFRGDVLKVLVDKLSSKKPDEDFTKCREALETLFRNDEDGNASLDAVAMLTKMMKAKGYRVDESVLNTFLHLRLLSEFGLKGSHTSIDAPSHDATTNGKKPKEKREFRSKKTRKIMKERKVIEKEFQEADATVSHEERDRMQSETLKLVFVTYFRILKARMPPLMGAVLEGLAKYAHLINQDFFGDLLEALKDLINDAELSENPADDGEGEGQDDEAEEVARNATRESLLCVITAFALLQGQDVAKSASALSLDLNFFITHLYRTLYPVSLNPDVERSARSLHLPDPHAASNAARSKVNIQTTIVLLLRSLTATLLPPQRPAAVPAPRLAAFTKTLLTASLHLPEKSCTALVGLMNNVTKTHAAKIASLWHTEERKGDGVFDPLRGDVEGSNPFAATVWEGELLRRHFSPAVREGVRGLERNVGVER
ncbi:hypothetical protein B0A49_00983 [Cryomyces minteri]|uniref:Nucleolar complex-associated protein 3 n=1 Tax=Cryomyces minteri TaxID=331657 RepID=A0A4U0XJC5_9PEZI|nr:hypothetical protein B0A49_00983 [Cryomyces minteri]